jgi:uncharacterized protein with PIN domain
MNCKGCDKKASKADTAEVKAIVKQATSIYGKVEMTWYCPECFLLTEAERSKTHGSQDKTQN